MQTTRLVNAGAIDDSEVQEYVVDSMTETVCQSDGAAEVSLRVCAGYEDSTGLHDCLQQYDRHESHYLQNRMSEPDCL